MVYLILKSGIIDKEAIAATVKDWLRPYPVRKNAPSRAMIGPPAPPPSAAIAASRRPHTVSPATNPYSSHQMLTRGDLYLSPKISLRQTGQTGKEQVHSFILDDYDVLVIRQAGLHHQWIHLKTAWSKSTTQLQAVPASHTANPASQTEWGRLQLAMASGVRQLPGHLVDTVQQIVKSLMTWQGILLIVAVTAVFILGGEVALLLMGAVAVYDLLMNVLPLLVEFYHAAIKATTTKQIDEAGAIFAKALLRGALDVIDILFAAGAYKRLLTLGGGQLTFGGVIAYLSERVQVLMNRMRQGTGNLKRLTQQAEEWARNNVKKITARKPVPFNKLTSPKQILDEALKRQEFKEGNPYPGGFKEKFTENGYDYEMRVHPPDAKAPPGSNSAGGPTYRLRRKAQGLDANGQGKGFEFMDDKGNWHRQADIKAGNPPQASNDTHIPIPHGTIK